MLSLFDQGPPAPCPSPFNMAAHVLAHADSQPDKTALAVLSPNSAACFSFAQIKSAVLGTGAGLLQAGLVPGDRVLMRLGNSVEFPIAYLGAIAVGLIPVPTSSQLTEPEVAKMIVDLAPGAILRDPEISCPDSPGCPVIGLDALLAMRDMAPAEFAMGDPDRLAYVIYTSGTSGTPRAVAHAHRAIWARQMMIDGWAGLRASDRLLHAGAFNWTYTLGTGLMDPWSMGATALIPAQGITPEMLPRLLKGHHATIFAAAPGVYRKLFSQQPGIGLPDLRHGLSAGEKLSDTIRESWAAATGTAIYEAYGMSECSTFISANPTSPAPPGTLGRPQPGRRIALVDGNGPVPLGTQGTIAVHRSDPGLMLGYLGAPQATADKFQGDWFLTGDLGVMEDDGTITYAGRGDDMMNAGGFRVSPLEVEAVLLRFPGILSVGVTDIEIKQDTRIIAAFFTASSDLDPSALTAYCQANLARYKQPRHFQQLTTLPTNANGKLSRAALRHNFEVSP